MSQLEASKKLDGNGKKVTPTKSLCSNQLELVPVIIPQLELVTVIILQLKLVTVIIPQRELVTVIIPQYVS